MYRAITRKIEVTVEPAFMPDRSAPDRGQFFWSYTIAPTVRCTAPNATALLTYYLPPAVLFRWAGTDEDGVRSQKPVQYKFKILTDQTEVSLQTARGDPQHQLPSIGGRPPKGRVATQDQSQ